MVGLSAVSTVLLRAEQYRGMPLLSLSRFLGNYDVIWWNVNFCHCEVRSNLISISQLVAFPDMHGLQIRAILIKFIKRICVCEEENYNV